MKHKIFKSWMAMIAIAFAGITIASCNKELPVAEPIVQKPPTGSSIVELLNDPDFSFLKAAVTRAGTNLTNLLSDKTAVFTFFAPNNAAFQLSGIPSEAALAAFRPGQLDTLLRYHLIGGRVIHSSEISTAFANMYLQSTFVLAPPSATLPPGLRMPIFPSKRSTAAWVNNIPIIQPDIEAANGIIHKVAALVAPPTLPLWARIATDPDLTYLKAAVERADTGDPNKTLQSALSNVVANLTVFAPTNLAFQQILTGQITLALIGQGMDPATAQATAATLASTPDVFQNPALASVLTPQTVAGIVAYHVLGIRAFSVNIPVTETNTPTLLNNFVPTHPGISVQATFGATGVTAATVKGLANPTASNIIINPTPAPNGTSDQHYINGTLHKIDQVLRPQ
ncbi:MAG: fasciclin domain-containing protein [Chitinophagaceae bacterium]|nr:fasciclin domain-containing protein [Chitinophagaceae bacterium]